MMVEFDQYEGRQKISASEFSEGTKYYANKLYPLVEDHIESIAIDTEDRNLSVIDLGSGDGQLACRLLNTDYVDHITLVDANNDLLGAASNNLIDAGFKPDKHYFLYKYDFIEDKNNYFETSERFNIATLINVTGYYDTDTLINLIARIDADHVIANFFVLEDNIDKEVIETNLFKSLTKNRLDHGNEYIFEFDLGWSDSTLNLRAMPRFEFNRMLQTLQQEYSVDVVVENYTDFKNEKMVVFYKN